MGRGYKARDTRLERLVAIKLLSEARRGDADHCARFIQEAKAASALNHPNIITIHEIGEHDGRMASALGRMPAQSDCCSAGPRARFL